MLLDVSCFYGDVHGLLVGQARDSLLVCGNGL